MSRNSIGCRGQFDLVSALCNHRFTRFQSGEYLYFRTVIGTQFHFPLLVTFFIQADKDGVNTLLLY